MFDDWDPYQRIIDLEIGALHRESDIDGLQQVIQRQAELLRELAIALETVYSVARLLDHRVRVLETDASSK